MEDKIKLIGSLYGDEYKAQIAIELTKSQLEEQLKPDSSKIYNHDIVWVEMTCLMAKKLKLCDKIIAHFKQEQPQPAKYCQCKNPIPNKQKDFCEYCFLPLEQPQPECACYPTVQEGFVKVNKDCPIHGSSKDKSEPAKQMSEEIPAPNVEFILRHYEKLSGENKKAFKMFLKFLLSQQGQGLPAKPSVEKLELSGNAITVEHNLAIRKIQDKLNEVIDIVNNLSQHSAQGRGEK